MNKEYAFPGMDYIDQHGKTNPPGMTLRDYFAAKAMQAEIEGGVHSDAMPKVAQRAYKMADAMMEARK
jgi:hypothetical protein